MGKYMNIKAIIHPAEEGGYWAEVPALPGCITEGDSMEEVMASLKEMIFSIAEFIENQ
jgi:predicted RNase H-like HicB family nuclease